MAFRPDGRIVMTCSPWDGTIRFWDIATGDELVGGRRHRRRRGLAGPHPGGALRRLGGGPAEGGLPRRRRPRRRPCRPLLPGLLPPRPARRAVPGQAPRPEVDFARSRPPLIRIDSPRRGRPSRPTPSPSRSRSRTRAAASGVRTSSRTASACSPPARRSGRAGS